MQSGENYWNILIYSLIIIKCDWGKLLPKIGKWLIATIKDKKATYSNLSLTQWIERKCAIDLIPVTSYKKVFVFLVGTTLKDFTNHSLKLAEVFSQ